MENQDYLSNPFDKPDSERKLALEVEGRKFWVSRENLAIHSPVFKTMLYGDFAEAKLDVVKLPKQKAADIEEVLRCLIPMPVCKEIDRSNSEVVLAFAREYQIEELRRRAEAFWALTLERCGKGNEQLLSILSVAASWQLNVRKQCLYRCVEELTLVSMLPLFDKLPEQMKTYVAFGRPDCRMVGYEVNHCFKHGKVTSHAHATCAVCGLSQCMTCCGEGKRGICGGKAKIDAIKKDLLDNV